ncbi:MAG: hypothetical protein IJ496_08045 [Ruminococcus sp.]|nr:hypothetical protein [Ruminococcus sp.]
MILLKTAINALKDNIIANLLTAIQLVASLFITAVMISSIMIRYEYYKPLKDVFQSNGIFCKFTMMANDTYTEEMNINHFIQNEEILQHLSGAEEVISCNSIMLYLTDDPDQLVNNYSYDDQLIERYQPELEEGRWLNTSAYADELEVVISENCYGYDLGDSIPLSFFDFPDSTLAEGRVVGILKDGAKIPGGFSASTGAYNYNQFYCPYYCDIEEIPVLLFSSDYIANLDAAHNIHQGLYSSVIITYPDGTDVSVIQEDQKKLRALGCSFSMLLKELEINNQNYLLEQFYQLFPIIAVLVILIIVSSVSSSALATKRRLKQYTIFYMLGLQWKHCVYINLLQSVLIAAVSLWLFIISIVAAQNTDIQGHITIINCGEVWLGLIGITVLYLMISMIMPIIIIGKSTPKQILTTKI